MTKQQELKIEIKKFERELPDKIIEDILKALRALKQYYLGDQTVKNNGNFVSYRCPLCRVINFVEDEEDVKIKKTYWRLKRKGLFPAKNFGGIFHGCMLCPYMHIDVVYCIKYWKDNHVMDISRERLAPSKRFLRLRLPLLDKQIAHYEDMLASRNIGNKGGAQ